ncbi:AI-2E family transporter [Roseburia sp. AM59-24XD]|uniref:AI-2E family transporter n=1 Tax=Roseburia sp. AM59-24XD TaxID=2293138 RepID=UPI000E4EF661|nr:AI-2E family transporter [Roseburia sp. AM59-24XD]RHP86617.1 AI-2E family transporter [Roseburia sp. AM59-24XD]
MRLLRPVDELPAGSAQEYLSRWTSGVIAGSSAKLSEHAGNLLTFCFSGTARFLTVILIIVVSMIALCGDMQVVHRIYRKSSFYPVVHRVAVTLKQSGLAYLKSQGIILMIIWIVCSVSLTLIHNPYSILIGCGIAVFDTFPVLGSGMILVPWAVCAAFGQNYYVAVILMIAFILCVVVRDLLEAHMMGNNMGLLPFFMTAALYGGVCLFGVWGILLGPFGVILIRSIYQQIV